MRTTGEESRPFGLVQRYGSTALAAIFLLASGCVSVRELPREPLDTGVTTGAVEVRIYPDDAARKADRLGPRWVSSRLERRSGEGWEPILRALVPFWTVDTLPPGKYRVVVDAVLDPAGNQIAVEDGIETLKVRSGERSRVQATLEHVNKAAIAGGVAGAVLAAVLLHDVVDDVVDDLIDVLPPPPPPEVLAGIALDVTWEAAIWADAYDPYGYSTSTGGSSYPPIVTAVFPSDGALVAEPRPRVILALSEPATVFDPGGVEVLSERLGPLPGTATYDPEHWWIVWDADDDLPAYDRIEIRLEAEAVHDVGGLPLAAPVVSFFRTTSRSDG